MKPGYGVSSSDPRIARTEARLRGLANLLQKFREKCPAEGDELANQFNMWKLYIDAGDSSNDGQDGLSNAETVGNLNGTPGVTHIFKSATINIDLLAHELSHLKAENVRIIQAEGLHETVRMVPWADRSWEKPAIDFERRLRELDCTCKK